MIAYFILFNWMIYLYSNYIQMEDKMLAQKNLNTQLSLLKDITDIDKNIIYDVNNTAIKIKEILIKVPKSPDEQSRIISKDDFEKILDMVWDLTDLRKFEKLGILSKQGIPERDMKYKILEKLQ